MKLQQLNIWKIIHFSWWNPINKIWDNFSVKSNKT